MYVRETITRDGFEFKIYDYGVEKDSRRFLLIFWNSTVKYSLNFYDPTNYVVWQCPTCGAEFNIEPMPECCSKCGNTFYKTSKHFPVADEIADRLKFGLKKTLKIKIGKKTNDFYLEVKGKQVLFKAGEPYFKKVS